MSQSDNRSASQIEREVEVSRANLEDTVEALKDKMSVGQMVDEASRYFGEGGTGEVVNKLVDQARSNPLPLALVGVGLVWLMSGRGQPHISSGRRYRGSDYDYESLGDDEYRRAFGESSVYTGSGHSAYSGRSPGTYETWDDEDGTQSGEGRLKRTAQGVRGAASGAASGIGSAVGGVADALGTVASAVGSAASGLGHAASRVGSTAYSAAGSVAGGARYAGETAWRGGSSAYRGASHLGAGAYSGASRFGSTAYGGASRFGRGTRRTFADVLETEPLVLVALGLAVGAAVGAFLPGTDVEDRYLGETRDRLREEAEAFAREKYEQGKAVAGDVYRTAKEEAEAQGLTTSGEDSLIDRVGQVARTTVERARESAAEKGLTSTGSGDDTGTQSASTASSGGQNKGGSRAV